MGHTPKPPERRGPRNVIFIVFAAALILRAIYAYDLPLDIDENDHYKIAKTCSLNPDNFNIPLRSGKMNQPILIVYIIALANWIGGGSIYAIRLVFVLLSMAGLAGLFCLVGALFGRRAAVIALIIGSLDRYLVCAAPRMIEQSLVIVMVPWIILQFHACMDSARVRGWLKLGLLFGIGYNIYPLVLFLVPPLFLYMLVDERRRKILTAPAPYLALGVLAASMLPHIAWDLAHGSPNLRYVTERAVHFGFGVTPRVLLLYIGDLLISLKDASWVILNKGYKMYVPAAIPCNWAAGLFYLFSFFYSFRNYKRDGRALLLFTIAGVAVPATILFPSEPWNNFWHANTAIYPMIAVASLTAESLASRRAGKIFIVTLLSYFGISMVAFLSGPKWAYMSPNREIAYAGRMDYLLNEDLFGKTGYREAADLTGAMIARRPNSPVAYYYEAYLSKDIDVRLDRLDKGLLIRPGDPLISIDKARLLSRKGRQEDAALLLRGLLDRGRRFYQIYYELGKLEYRAGDYGEAERQVREALAMRPDNLDLYKMLFFIQDAQGDMEAAGQTLRIFTARSFGAPYTAYAIVAEDFVKEGKFDKAADYIDRIKRSLALPGGNRNKIDPDFIDAYYNLGARLARAGKDAEALDIFKKVIEIDPRHAFARNALEALMPHRE
ncbi:MAG: glycosyltransferase family 39 protein [Candidatus Omnitrophota bacterium]